MASETAQTLNLIPPCRLFCPRDFLSLSFGDDRRTDHLRKSKPVCSQPVSFWAVIALVYAEHNFAPSGREAVRHSLLEYARAYAVLLVAMTYISAMEERKGV